MKRLVMIHNIDGRPCAWGLSIERKDALDEANLQWEAYVRKNPGVQRGKTRVHDIPEAKPTRLTTGGSM